MSATRILHVDDEPDIREIVAISLGLNTEFEVRACACGPDAITTAAEWSPFLILLDVMMPGMDGPTTLTHLRDNPRTGDIPVLFMTARAQAREVDQFIALGAHGVISKPFDPMMLATEVRNHLHTIKLASLRTGFMRRAKSDAELLAAFRSSLGEDSYSATASQIRKIAHGLAGAAGLYGFDQISSNAAALEDALVATLEGGGTSKEVVHALDRLMSQMESQWETPQLNRAQSAA
jgi:CheY-like chemotaxis protein